MRFLLLLLGITIVSCGQSICFGPFGNCYSATASTAAGASCGTQLPTIDIVLPSTFVNRRLVPLGSVVNLSAINGTGSYRWTSSGNGTVDPNTGIFTSSNNKGDTTIVTVTDTNLNYISVSFTNVNQ